LAIWQGLHPNGWWNAADVGDVKQFLPTAPLEPFHSNTERTTYDSDTVRHHFSLGYTYPELQKWKYDSEEAYKNSIVKAVHDLYGDHQDDAAGLQAVSTYGDYIVNIKYKRYNIG
jgi:tyrosinase